MWGSCPVMKAQSLLSKYVLRQLAARGSPALHFCYWMGAALQVHVPLPPDAPVLTGHYTVLRPSHISLKKVSIYTRARTQKSCTVSQLVCAFPNPV